MLKPTNSSFYWKRIHFGQIGFQKNIIIHSLYLEELKAQTTPHIPISLFPAVFKKVNSIADDISSAQTYYEKKIVSVQENLQELGECSDPHGALAPLYLLTMGCEPSGSRVALGVQGLCRVTSQMGLGGLVVSGANTTWEGQFCCQSAGWKLLFALAVGRGLVQGRSYRAFSESLYPDWRKN